MFFFMISQGNGVSVTPTISVHRVLVVDRRKFSMIAVIQCIGPLVGKVSVVLLLFLFAVFLFL